MSEIYISLNIPADEFQRLYQGVARDVVARAQDGRRVRFPARILRQFVDHQGVRGYFRIQFDNDNRFLGIEKIH